MNELILKKWTYFDLHKHNYIIKRITTSLAHQYIKGLLEVYSITKRVLNSLIINE